jgi:hypothetical protein
MAPPAGDGTTGRCRDRGTGFPSDRPTVASSRMNALVGVGIPGAKPSGTGTVG